jgi:hypothetical protein
MDWERSDRIANRAQFPLTFGGYVGWAYTLWPKGAVLFGSPRTMNSMAVAAGAVLLLEILNVASQMGLLRSHKRIRSTPTLATNDQFKSLKEEMALHATIDPSGKPELRRVSIASDIPIRPLSYNDNNATHLAVVLALTNEPRFDFQDTVAPAKKVVAHIKFFDDDDEVSVEDIDASARRFVHYGAWLEHTSNTVPFDPHTTRYLVLAVAALSEPNTWLCVENHCGSDDSLSEFEYRELPNPLGGISVDLVIDGAKARNYFFDVDDLKEMAGENNSI